MTKGRKATPRAHSIGAFNIVKIEFNIVILRKNDIIGIDF